MLQAYWFVFERPFWIQLEQRLDVLKPYPGVHKISRCIYGYYRTTSHTHSLMRTASGIKASQRDYDIVADFARHLMLFLMMSIPTPRPQVLSL